MWGVWKGLHGTLRVTWTRCCDNGAVIFCISCDRNIQRSVLESHPINEGTNCSIELWSSFHKHCIVGDSIVLQKQLHSLRTHSLARGHKANRRETISGQWSLAKYAEVTTQAVAVGRR